MSKFGFVIKILWVLLLLVCMVYEAMLGISNHDAYYIAWVILDFMMLHLSIKEIEEDIDKMQKV